MMRSESPSEGPQKTLGKWVAVLCALLLMPGDAGLFAQSAQPSAPPAQEAAADLPPEQLDSLVAPIALYPDPLLAQMLAASTYPLEVIQLQQWLAGHKDLKGKALEDAVMKQDWDPSVQGLAPMPDAVKQLSENIKWTTDLGNAFLAQQNGVMEAVQRMRKKAKDAGALATNQQQKVETKVVESKPVIVIQQADPQVVYVPSYNPTVVYGPPVYPYPPIVYPPPPPPGAYVATAAIAFGVGMAMGAAWGGGWGYNCGWGGNNTVNVNVNNSYNKNSVNNINRSGGAATRPAGGANGSWQHNPQHRGGAPYSNQATANKYGGSTRGGSAANRQNQGNRQQAGASNRGGASASNRQQPSASNRSSASASNRQQPSSANRGGGSSQDRVGNKSVSSGASKGGSGAFGGGSGGNSGASAKASSSRGSSSMSGSRGGGSRSGGGGRRK